MSLEAELHLTRGDLSVEVELAAGPGEVVALLGPNGAGKSTVLAALAGLLPIGAGRIVLGGRVLEDRARGTWVPPDQRAIGVVFQDLLLFGHLDVRDNVAFGPRAKGLTRHGARRLADDHLVGLGLDHLGDRRPSELSGGEAQLVGLARALATDPRLLLLDEPLAALDVETRQRIRRMLRTHLSNFAGPTVLVTHAPLEAIALADQLVIVQGGRVVQRGPVDEVARRPRSHWVASLVGLNLYRGRARRGEVSLDCTTIVAADPRDGDVFAVVHPRAVAVHRGRPEGSPRNVWRGDAANLDVRGERARLEVVGPLRIVAEVTPAAVAELELASGGEVWVSVKASEVELYPA